MNSRLQDLYGLATDPQNGGVSGVPTRHYPHFGFGRPVILLHFVVGGRLHNTTNVAI